QLIIVNGNADGSNRVSSARIALNGVQILGPSDFNQHVATIVRPVTLTDPTQLTIQLNSAPGSFITVSVECGTRAKIVVAPGILSSVWSNGIVSLAIPLENEGNEDAPHIMISNIQATGGTYDGPTPFPYSAGELEPNEERPIYGQFS